jgi:hypothetical protein
VTPPRTEAIDPGTTPASNRAAWRALAALLAALHVGYVLFVLFGALLVLVWPPLVWLHLAAVAWAGGTMIGDLGCPVTTWEKTAMRRAGSEPYPEGFLQHHVLRHTFDPSKARRNHIILGLAALALNAVLYFLVLNR